MAASGTGVYRRDPLTLTVGVILTMSGDLVALCGGAVGGAAFYSIAMRARRSGQVALSIALVAASLVYVAAAFTTPDAAHWMIIEIGGLLLFSILAGAGLQRSIWLLVAGWVAHPFWDLFQLLRAPAFAPRWFAVACISWDWVVAFRVAHRASR